MMCYTAELFNLWSV